MAENKTIENNASVNNFINSVENKTRRNDAVKLNDIFIEITNTKPKMWGPSIIGFGKYNYKYKSGKAGQFMKIGFSPRKTSLSLYIMDNHEKYTSLLVKLGKHKISKACLYINKLADVDENILKKIIAKSWVYMCEKYDF